MIKGMTVGIFTGEKLSDHINNDKKDYINSRRIINGLDKANIIANYAEQIEQIILDTSSC